MTNYAPVSVIIPCYNSADTIKRAVDSIFLQTWLPSEVIIVDDCSTDNGRTLQCLQDLKLTYPSIQLVLLTKNHGPGNARNLGWDIATQDYIAFLDSDDAWHPQKIEIQIKIMLADKEVDISGHDTCITEKSKEFNKYELIEENSLLTVLTKKQFLFSNRYATSSVILKRDIGYRFISSKKYSEDFLLWLSIVLSHKKAIKINKTLLFTFKQPFGVSGLSSRLWKMEKGELETYKIIGASFSVNQIYLFFIKIYSLTKFFYRLLRTYMLPRGKTGVNQHGFKQNDQ